MNKFVSFDEHLTLVKVQYEDCNRYHVAVHRSFKAVNKRHLWRGINVDLSYFQKDAVTNICQAADKQLFTLVEWAKMIPHFSELPVDDQVILLRAGELS